jgi:protein phosphatase PTC7
VCYAVLCPQGDSGFVVVRGGQIVLRSSPKQHFFDCPLQFGAYPEHVDDTDTADDAEVYQLPVLPGDVIIAGGG